MRRGRAGDFCAESFFRFSSRICEESHQAYNYSFLQPHFLLIFFCVFPKIKHKEKKSFNLNFQKLNIV